MVRIIYFGKQNLADIPYDPHLKRLYYKVIYHSRGAEINWVILDNAALI
jgi:hypothetical protein